jgi:methylmalonyl-CoA/ethylmalonyl-CoA epimerase
VSNNDSTTTANGTTATGGSAAAGAAGAGTASATKAGPAGLLTEIDHVAIAVRDLEAAIDYYAETFGATVAHRERIESDGVEEALIKVADSYIQLLTPTSDSSPVAKYLEKKGEGIHHVGYRVADCGVAVQAVKDHGGQMIDQAPRPGSRGTTVAFVHPKSAFGTLIELVQE